MPTSQTCPTCNNISMPLSHTGSYLHTYIRVTYRCQE
ncbi:Suppressor-of-stellate-like protein [Gossypium arboreum]|uniref:Suppressor-of-stellate-like protein n=1 Tax=Gossypium arboreum TaxID=29729 RepID=A0A0B0PB57_GOSAR|nr:Suppressor-of-stellate-like protein [Gossypium arboreum]